MSSAPTEPSKWWPPGLALLAFLAMLARLVSGGPDEFSSGDGGGAG